MTKSERLGGFFHAIG